MFEVNSKPVQSHCRKHRRINSLNASVALILKPVSWCLCSWWHLCFIEISANYHLLDFMSMEFILVKYETSFCVFKSQIASFFEVQKYL